MITKQPIDIEDLHADIVQKALQKHLPTGALVYVFGSRATWQAKHTSDLDLAIDIKTTDKKCLYDLEEELSDSDLPYKVDIVNLNTITDSFKKAIIQDFVPVLWEWKTCRLGDAPLKIIDGDRGKNYPSQDQFSDNGYCLFLSTKNVRSDGFDFSDCQFISRERDELLRKGRLERNDLILTTRGTVGNIGFFNNSVAFERIRINSGMVIVRPNKDELLPEFNYYVFRKLQKDFDVFTSGSAQPQLPIRDLNEIEILLPPLPEQRAIGGVLSNLDDKIDLLHRQNQTLESLAETLFRHTFINNAREEWEEKPVKFFGDVICGKTPSKKIAQYYGGEIPFIKIPDMHGHIFVSQTTDKLSEEGLQSQNKKTLPPFSICVSCIATVGRCQYSCRIFVKKI